MRNYIFKKTNILIIACLILFIAIFVGMNLIGFKASAASTTVIDFTGVTGSLEGTDLYNATNTYSYNGDNEFYDRNYQYYDTSERLENIAVSINAPQITVLTHGLGGDASHWSNNEGVFAYDEDSLISRLSLELSKNGQGGANIYWAVMQDSTSFQLFDLNDSKNRILKEVANENGGIESKYVYEWKESTNAITDISKHIIIVFESSNFDGYNYEVYEEFNYMLSKIIYDVKILSGGVLPKINLIGHSRGGITNLQYALDHPELVASMFSLGTPYFGSDSASTPLGEEFAPGNGRLDIINRNVYLNYYNRWHNNYNELYSGINVHALGGYSDTDFIFDALIASDDEDIEKILQDENLATIKMLIKGVPALFATLDSAAEIEEQLDIIYEDSVLSQVEAEIYIQVISDIQYPSWDDEEDILTNVWNNLVHNRPFEGSPYFMNDLLVDLPSQIGFDKHGDGYVYDGFNVYTKCFLNKDYEEGEEKKLSIYDMPAVVHNLEARDEDMINYILSNISQGAHNGYVYKQTSPSTATLTGFYGDNFAGSVILPAEIDGLTVNRIGFDLFKGKGGAITSLTIPASVEIIDEGAFRGLTDLTAVVIPTNSELRSIGSMAFANCTSLESFNVTSNVTSIGADAFYNCLELTSFSVSDTNIVYAVENGIIYNKTFTKILHYPEGKTTSIYEIPATVTEIAAYAFSGNAEIEQLHIYGTPIIGAYAFFDCENLEEVYFYSDTVPEVGTGAFMRTDFTLYVPHRKQAEYEVEFARYTSFIESIPIVVTFTSDDEQVQVLNTYYGADIINVENPSKEGYVFNYWVDDEGNIYQNGDVWNITEDITLYADWTARQSYINFYVNGMGIISDKLVTYDAPIGTMPVPNVAESEFLGWKDANGVYYNANTIWSNTANLILFADFEGEEESPVTLYRVNLDKGVGVGGSDNVMAVYMDDMPIATAPTRIGYDFCGYFTGTSGSGVQYYTANMTSVRAWNISSETTLYAWWVPLQFVVTLDYNDGTNRTSNIIVTYDSDMPTNVSAPTRLGYTFDGYYDDDNNQYYVGEDMTSATTWDKLYSTTLVAKWIKDVYEITLDFDCEEFYDSTITACYDERVVATGSAKYVQNRIGYDFDGFYTGKNGSGEKYFDFKISGYFSEYCYELVPTGECWPYVENGTLYAKWTVIAVEYKYEIVISNADEDSKIRTINLTHGTNVTIQAPSISGYTFEEMYVNGDYYQTNSYQLNNVQLKRNLGYGIDGYEDSKPVYLWYPMYNTEPYVNEGGLFMVYKKKPAEDSSCIAEGSLITLADGRQVPVESLTGNETLLVWNLHTGNFDVAPILFIDYDPAKEYKIINLTFSDGTQVKVIYEHAFWDFNLNKYVYMRDDASQYVGHWFNKQSTDSNGNLIWTRVQLTNVTITHEYTTAWSPVTYGHLCIYVNGMLSMPGATEGLVNIFEVDGDTMKIKQEQFFADIETYGLFTYEEFAQIYPIPEEMFNAVDGQYLKVSLGKELIDYETLNKLIEEYSSFFE